MALLHSDGFDSHATGAAVLADGNPTFGAQVGVSIDATAGRFGGKALTLAANTTGSVALAIPAPTSNASIAGWFKVGALAAADLLFDTSAKLSVDATGALIVRDGAGTIRITTAAGVVTADAYQWIEVSYRSSGINLYVNGVPTGTPYVGAYTAPVWASLKVLNSTGTNPAMTADDVIVWDSSTSFFNSFGLAPRRIQLLRPNAAGASSAWVPASGSNWAAVDDTDWSGGVGVSATNIGQKDRYQFTDLAATPGAVDAVTVRAKAVSTGSDPATLQLVNAQGGTEATSPAATVPTSAAVMQASFYRDANNVAWTEATVNSAEFGQILGA